MTTDPANPITPTATPTATMALTAPPFPAALESLAAPGMLEALSALELGMFVRLVRLAWDQGCTLPDEVTFLAAVARTTPEELAAARPRLLLAFGDPNPPPGPADGGRGGRLLLPAARKVYDALVQARARTTAAKREAGKAGAASRWGSTTPDHQPDHPADHPDRMARDSSRMAAAKQVPSGAIGGAGRAVSARASGSLLPPALSLQRSSESAIQSAPEGRAEVLALMGEGARAIEAQRVEDWRRRHCARMLEAAIAEWRTSGFSTFPLTRVQELASCRHATPALVDTLIEYAKGCVAAAQAAREAAREAKARGQKKPEGRTECSPVGILLHGLGESERSGGRPQAPTLQAAARWDKQEAEMRRLLAAGAAIHAQRDRATSVPNLNPSPRTAPQGATGA